MIAVLIFLTIAMAYLLSLAKRQFPKTLAPCVRANEKSDASLVVHCLEKTLMMASINQSLERALKQFENKELSLRQTLLQICISPLAIWPAVLFVLLCMNISGIYLAGISALVLVVLNRIKSRIRFDEKLLGAFTKMISYLTVIFFIALSLVFFEQALRSSGQMLMVAYEFDWIFYISQSEWDHMFILFFVSMAITAVLRLEAWSLIFSLMMLVTGLMAFNNAIVFVVGEFVAILVLFLLDTRKSKAPEKKYLYVYSGLGIVAYLLGGFVLLTNKELIFADLGQIMNVQNRLAAFALSITGLLFVTTAITCLWGHLFIKTQLKRGPEAQT